MKKLLYSLSVLLTTIGPASAAIDQLIGQLQLLKEGDKLTFEYAFQGCYGPYHHGRIVMKLIEDTIYYTETNYDHQGTEGLSQSGQYQRDRLLELLADAGRKTSPEILGHAMSFRLSINDQETDRGAAKLDQAHFISIFQPFTSKFPAKKKSPVPGLKTGGFVN